MAANDVIDMVQATTDTTEETLATKAKMLPSNGENKMVEETADSDGNRRLLWRNIVVANVASSFVHLSVAPLLMLQTSLYEEDGLGTAVLFIIFGSIVPVCFMAGAIVSKFGSKTLMMFYPVGGFVFMLANFHPKTYVLIPASVVAGFAISLGHVAIRAYTGKIGHRYASLFGEDSDRIHGRVSSIFYIVYRSSVLLGSVISSSILGLRRDGDDQWTTNAREIYERRLAVGVRCGAHYCNEDLTTPLFGPFNLTESTTSLYRRPADLQLYAFLALGMVLSILALLIMLFRLQGICRLGMSECASMGSWRLLTGVVRQHADPRFLLLLPIMLTPNVNDYFWSADFTKAFVTCSIGIHNNGYVNMWSSVSSIACCCFFGWFNTKNSRIASIALATVIQLVTAVVLLQYEPDDGSFVLLCIFSAAWYLGSGIRQSLVPAIVAVVLSDNLSISFSNFMLWAGIGGAVVFGLHNVFCIHTKIVAIIVFNTIAFVLYAAFEVRQRFGKKT